MTFSSRRRRGHAGVLVSCLLSAALVLAACGGAPTGGGAARGDGAGQRAFAVGVGGAAGTRDGISVRGRCCAPRVIAPATSAPAARRRRVTA